MTMIIGIDPHKATHMVVAIDDEERPVAWFEVRAGRCQAQRLLAWAAPLGAERTWAIESADGLGKLLSQELLAAGEHVVDVPSTLAARVRLLGSANAAKNDPTTRCRSRSRVCATANCGPFVVMITRRCFGYWPAATTT